MQEVFIAYMQTEAKVENTKAWLVAAMCNASRHYWRTQARTESLPENIGDHSDPVTHGLADRFAIMLTLRQALRYLQPRCRETLYLHYFEGRSAKTTNMLHAFAERTKAEDAAAGLIVAKLLAVTPEERTALLAKNPQWRTAGVVRRLLKVVDEKIFLEPKFALDLTVTAVAV